MSISKALAVALSATSPNVAALSPTDLAVSPIVQQLVVPDYNFVTQQRTTKGDTQLAGRFTGGSVQTYGYDGRPNDSNADSND